MTSPKFNMLDRIKSFKFAIHGIKNLLIHEHNARIHLFVTICVIILGLYVHITTLEWILLSMVIGLVFIVETLNTAIERLADSVEPNFNKQIGMVKDYAAGAVLISSIVAMITGVLIFWKYLIY